MESMEPTKFTNTESANPQRKATRSGLFPRLLVGQALLLAAAAVLSPSPLEAQGRPPLFFREDWKQIPEAIPVTQEHVANSNVVLALHGPGRGVIKKSHHDQPADDPYYIWSGLCPANWAVSLGHRSAEVDLTGLAKIRWRSKQSGFRELRIVIELAGGTWLVSDQSDPASEDWRVREFNISDIRWRELDIEKVIEGDWAESPDLSKVARVGWTDLMPGGQSIACSRLDWIEVYGKKVSRQEASDR